MTGQYIVYRRCAIRYDATLGAYYWEDTQWGMESDDIFQSVEAAKADIDRIMADTPATTAQIEDELSRRQMESQP